MSDIKTLKRLVISAFRCFNVFENVIKKSRLGRGGRRFESCHPETLKDKGFSHFG